MTEDDQQHRGWLRRWYAELVGAAVAIGVLAVSWPQLRRGPRFGGTPLLKVPGTPDGGLDRLLTDTVVGLFEWLVIVVAASVAGGLAAGLLRGRFVSRTRWGGLEENVGDAAEGVGGAFGEVRAAVHKLREQTDSHADMLLELYDSRDDGEEPVKEGEGRPSSG